MGLVERGFVDAACAFPGGPLAQELEDIAAVVPGVLGLAGALPDVSSFQAPLSLVLAALLAGLLYAPPAEPPLPRLAGVLQEGTVLHACSEGLVLFEELGAVSVDEPAPVGVADVVSASV